jgi:hypothetical protein
MKRWLFLVHRWLGIPLCLVLAAWFLSGMVMLYVGYPRLTNEERLQGLPPLASLTALSTASVVSPDGCCVPLAQALASADVAPGPTKGKPLGNWRLTSVANAPLYVFDDGNLRAVAVDARSGQRVTEVNTAQALASARHFAGGVPANHLGLVHEDAWTHSRALDAHRPLHRVAVADEAQRWLYVSSRTGEVVRDASFTERSWGWVGAWLHWLYMFRGGAVNGWWTDIVIWSSVAGTVLAATGLLVGVMRWRRQPYRSGRRTPYTGFMARWHHWLGLAGGVLAITWVLSGLLSMNPWKVFDSGGPRPDRKAFAGGPLLPEQAPDVNRALAALQARGLVAKELEWRRVGGVHYVLAHGGGVPWVLDTQGLRDDGIATAHWRQAAAALIPGARVVQEEHLTAFDAYYYAREAHTMGGNRGRPLPVWRLHFDDEHHTQATLDPHTGDLLMVQDSRRRVSRWLFAFLHSFDLPSLLSARPAWDLWMLGFSLAGLGLSLTGVVTGLRRLLRKVPRKSLPSHHVQPGPADSPAG